MIAATRLRSLGAALVLVACLGALALVLARVVAELDAEPDALENKVRGAERHLYYRVTAGDGPRFALDGPTSLRLVSHVRFPDGLAYDPARVAVYGLRLIVRAPGRADWIRDVYASTRQSKARRAARVWLDENAFSLERPDLQLGDDRSALIELAADTPAGAELSVRAIAGDGASAIASASGEVLVRVAGRATRSDGQRQRRLDRLMRDGPDDPAGYLPWTRLARAERLARLRVVEELMPALGRDGVDYRVTAVHDTGFRLPPPDDDPGDASIVSRGRGVALDVAGPAALSVRARAIGPGATLGVSVLATDGARREQSLPVTRDADAVAAIAVGPGVHTVMLTSEDAEGARVEVEARPGVAFGAPIAMATAPTAIATAPTTTTSTSTSPIRLTPLEVGVATYLTAPDAAPLVIGLDSGGDVLGRTLRVDVRLLVDSDAAPVTGHLLVWIVDADGRSRSLPASAIVAAPSRFDSARLFGPRTARVTEPVALYLVAPASARAVRLSSSVPALLRLSSATALTPAADALAAPFAGVALAGTRWRYAPLATRGWWPFRPDNHDALVPARVARIDAQVRLELALEPPHPDDAALALIPHGRAERQIMLEAIAAADAPRALAHWTLGDHTQLETGAPRALDLSASPSRPHVRYWASGAALGQTVSLVVDGEVVARERVRASRGTWELPADHGVHTVAVRTAARGLRLLVDRPPARGARGDAHLFALRTVYALRGPIRIAVAKGSAPVAVNAIVYGAAAAADPSAHLRVRIDGGAPRRAEARALTRWTDADATLPVPAADRPPTLGFADVSGGRLHPRLVVVTLGDDLAAGSHTVEILPTGTARGWIRAFVLTDRTPERASQWRALDDGADQ